MNAVRDRTLMAGILVQRAAQRLARDQRGLTVSAVMLIGILVVAVVAFGTIAAGRIRDAGTEVQNVDFGGGGG